MRIKEDGTQAWHRTSGQSVLPGVIFSSSNVLISNRTNTNNCWVIRISVIGYYRFSVSTNGGSHSNDDILLLFMWTLALFGMLDISTSSNTFL